MDAAGLIIGLFFFAIGGLVGMNAANKRGFSVVGGAIGGAFLGILSPLLYLAKGTMQPCPHCREWMQPAAAVCPHCRMPAQVAAAKPAPKPTAPQRFDIQCPHCQGAISLEL
jgi:hypothetical protein